MTNKIMKWHDRDEGRNIGTRNRESGILVRDEEYGRVAHISLYRDSAYSPWLVYGGFYGGGFSIHSQHETQPDAAKAYADIRNEIENAAGLIECSPLEFVKQLSELKGKYGL